jgi:hypothetical protein
VVVDQQIGGPGRRLLEAPGGQLFLDVGLKSFLEERIVVETRIARRRRVGYRSDNA